MSMKAYPPSLGFARSAPCRPLAYTPSLGFAKSAPCRPLAYTPSLGLTLVEMLVVIAMAGILAFTSLAFTGAWVDSNRLMDSQNIVLQGFRHAKAAALRNTHGITGDSAASVLCFSNHTIVVRIATNSSTPASCSSGTSIWQSLLSDRLNIKDTGDSNFSCSCLTNKGVLTTTSTACGSCIDNAAITLNSGSESLPVTLL